MSDSSILDFDYRTGTPEEFARALFGRPIAATEDEKDAVGSGPYDPPCGDATFVRLCTGLFERFGELSAGYSDDQIEQGLWMVCGNPYFLVLNQLADADLPVGLAVDCVRASYHLYSDYLAPRLSYRHAGPLYMWWDQAWTNGSSDFGPPEPQLLDAVLETLGRILEISDSECQRAALHGLAHFKQDWDETAGKAVIDAFIAQHRAEVSDELIAYAEFCRDEFHV